MYGEPCSKSRTSSMLMVDTDTGWMTTTRHASHSLSIAQARLVGALRQTSRPRHHPGRPQPRYLYGVESVHPSDSFVFKHDMAMPDASHWR